MDKIATNKRTLEIIKKNNFVVKKRFGQNFLVDERVLSRILTACEIDENDVVIEVGPGIGGLTQPLAEMAHAVIAVEIDKTLIPILNETLSEYTNVTIINDDILKTDIKKLVENYGGKRIKVVANLPYYITTPIIMGMLSNKAPVDLILVMVQKEVALRMAASPGSKNFGSLSLAVTYYAQPRLVANVPRNSFVPRPAVDSAVISLEVRKEPKVTVKDERLLFDIIKSAFSMRRKTLLNCLHQNEQLNLSKETIKQIIADCGFDENVRGEALTLEHFAVLTDAVLEIPNGNQGG